MARKIKTLGFYGGKRYIVPHLLKLMPPHKLYVELFGGGAALLFSKPPSPIEVYNDIDSNLVNLFRVLRDDKLFPIFLHKLKWTLYSREEWRRARKSYRFPNNPVERAVRFFITVRQSFSKQGTSWAYGIEAKNMARAYFKFIKELDYFHQRLENVQIENLDWYDCLKKYNIRDSFFYCLEPHTEILTPQGIKAIKDIKPGEFVITPYGPRRVIANLRRFVNDFAIKLNIMGLGRQHLICSGEHKFFVKENKNAAPSWRDAKSLAVGNYIAIGTDNRIFHFSAPPIINKKYREKILDYPKDAEKLAYLAGWFAAEGHYAKGLHFNLGKHEINYAKEIQSIIKELFNIDAQIILPPHTPNDSVILVRCFSCNLEDYFKKYIVGYNSELGRGKGKYLKEWLLYASPEIQINFLRGWLRGDGNLTIINECTENPKFRRSGKRNKYKYTGTTASHTMAWQIYHIALRCGLHPNIKRRGNNYDIYFTTLADMQKLLNIQISGRICKRRFWQDGFLWAPITKIERIKYNNYMHDLSLESVHSYYLSNGVLTHNCDPPYVISARRSRRKAYSHDFSIEDHEKLVEVLINEFKGKGALSGYKNEIYARLEKEGWTRIDIEVPLFASGGPTTRKARNKNVPRPKAVESIWINYQLPSLKI